MKSETDQLLEKSLDALEKRYAQQSSLLIERLEQSEQAQANLAKQVTTLSSRVTGLSEQATCLGEQVSELTELLTS